MSRVRLPKSQRDKRLEYLLSVRQAIADRIKAAQQELAEFDELFPDLPYHAAHPYKDTKEKPTEDQAERDAIEQIKKAWEEHKKRGLGVVPAVPMTTPPTWTSPSPPPTWYHPYGHGAITECWTTRLSDGTT